MFEISADLFLDSDGKPNPFPLSLCMEMRVMKKSDTLMCPASITCNSDEKHIAYIEVLSTATTPGYLPYFSIIGHLWKFLEGIPHWQKQFKVLTDYDDPFVLPMVKYLQEKYKANLKRFNAVQKEIDPSQIFMNKTMKEILLATKSETVTPQ